MATRGRNRPRTLLDLDGAKIGSIILCDAKDGWLSFNIFQPHFCTTSD
jgi:hypothetical protein